MIFIEGRRNSPDQCGRTMTVRELIDYLENNFDDDQEVFLDNDRGYTFGNITESSFSAVDEDSEEE